MSSRLTLKVRLKGAELFPENVKILSMISKFDFQSLHGIPMQL